MPKNIVSPEEADELKRLEAQLIEAQKRVAEALRTGGEFFTGQREARLIEAQRAESEIYRRIKEIRGA